MSQFSRQLILLDTESQKSKFLVLFLVSGVILLHSLDCITYFMTIAAIVPEDFVYVVQLMGI